MIIRFVQGSELVSRLIIAQEKTSMPLCPSHTEAVTPEGKWLGAHFKGGVQAREAGYDKDVTTRDLFLTLEATPDQDKTFYEFLNGHIGEPYDWEAILGFILPEHLHIPNHAICSALITLALRACNWFKWPVAAPAHLISPRDLLLMVSARMQVPM